MGFSYVTDQKKQFQDKVIIITGSTQGMGAETAKLFAWRGAKAITICGRQEGKGRVIKSEIEAKGSKCLFVKTDLNNIDDCLKVVSRTDEEFGTVNCLVNVAGYTERGTILSTTLENFDRNFNINTKAPFILMQEVIKIMLRDKNMGTIANVLSMALYSGMPFLAAYSASKAALGTLVKNVANAVAGHQIRVNGVNIGWSDTPGEHSIQTRVHKGQDNWLKYVEPRVPFKRLIKPIDVARIIAFLCSEESGLVTGSLMDYDQTVHGWHSYSAYNTNVLNKSLLGE